MEKDTCEKRPQVGPDCSAVGESHPAPAGCPSYSGVGNKCLSSVSSETNNDHTREKRTPITMNQNDDYEPSGSKPTEEMVVQCAPEERLPVTRLTATRPSISRRRDGHKRQRDAAASGDLSPPSKVPMKATSSRGGGPPRDRRGRFVRPGMPDGSYGSYTEGSESDSQSVPPTCQTCTEASEEEGMDVQARTQIIPSAATGESSAGSAEALEKAALQDIQVVLDTTRKSKNMKGTCQRAIKDAAERVRVAIEGLASRSSSEETRRLQLENDRLRKEVGALRKEMESLRAEVRSIGRQPPEQTQTQPQSLRPSSVESSSSDDIIRAAISQIGKMLDARFAGIEDRLLPAKNNRPPLAADIRNAAGNAARSAANTSRSSKKPSMASREAFQAASQVMTQAAETQQSDPVPSRNTAITQDPTLLTSVNDGWQTAAKRKRGKRKKKQPAPNTVASATGVETGSGSKMRKRQLRAPKSAAVVLTLQPEAVQKGLTYAAVISRAKESVNLADLGITDIRFRQAATGARLLEFPGAEGTKGADLIAEKLRGIFYEDVKVSRPTKCAEMRICGLDDSITGGDVQEAIARKTGCPADAVRVGPIRLGPGGVGSAWAQCPVEAAKILADAGRLLVGWSSASVRILEARPMRCFKCMEKGHTRHKCTSTTDLSGLCFRCGKPGHLASTCSADPHCPLCEEAKLPANHVVGSKGCKPPVPSKRKKATASTPVASSVVRLERSQEEVMIAD